MDLDIYMMKQIHQEMVPLPVTSLVNQPPWGFNGFNARWAQFAWLDREPPYKNYLFEKLGTEMHPLTDYNITFTIVEW